MCIRDRDRNAAGPQDPDAEVKAINAATDAINTASEHGLFTENAQSVIKETIAESQEISTKLSNNNNLTVLEKLALDNARREKENALRALIIRVRDSERYKKIEDGVLAAIGPAVIAAVTYGMFQLLSLVMSLFG